MSHSAYHSSVFSHLLPFYHSLPVHHNEACSPGLQFYSMSFNQRPVDCFQLIQVVCFHSIQYPWLTHRHLHRTSFPITSTVSTELSIDTQNTSKADYREHVSHLPFYLDCIVAATRAWSGLHVFPSIPSDFYQRRDPEAHCESSRKEALSMTNVIRSRFLPLTSSLLSPMVLQLPLA